MPQSQYKTQEELYAAQRAARDKKQTAQPTFQSAPISDLAKASEALRISRLQPLPSRRLVSPQGQLQALPQSLLALMGLGE